MRKLANLACVAALSASLAAPACSSDSGGANRDDKSDDGVNDSPVTDDAHGVACADALDKIPADAWHPEGRIAAEHEGAVVGAMRTCLSHLIQLNTSNPATDSEPGETAAVHFFETVFARLGLQTRRTPLSRNPSAKRLSVIASRKGSTDQKSVLLLNHTDVVRAEGDWTHDPFSGHDDGEYVWGRGALDMKGIGITQLVALAVLHKAGVELERDVHFAAVADEEVGGTGGEFVAVTRVNADGSLEAVDPLGLNPGVVINEGGNGIKDALVPARDFYVIGVEEKGAVWTQFAHADPAELIAAYARIGVVEAPDSDSFASSAVRERLGEACTLVGMISDEEQKTNVQPRRATIELQCAAGAASEVEGALADISASFNPHPELTVNTDGDKVTVGIVMGAGGHGSTGVSHNSLHVALSVLISTGQLDPSQLETDSSAAKEFFDFSLTPANQQFVENLSRSWGQIVSSLAEWIASSEFVSRMLLRIGRSLLPTDSPFRTTCNWTTFLFPAEGGEARAKLDCRIHDAHADGRTFEQDLLAQLSKTGVSLRNETDACFDCYYQDYNASPFGDDVPDYETIRWVIDKSSPDAVVTPYLFPASSDTYFFRAAGVPTYGIWPAVISQAELEGIHAIDERMPISTMFRAIDGYAQMVYRLADNVPVPDTSSDRKLGKDTVTCFEWGGSSWDAVDDDHLICGLVGTREYYCDVAADAPRYIRGVVLDNDARVNTVAQLSSSFDPNSGAFPAGDAISRVVYESREPDDKGTRVFEDGEFEIDSGSGDSRRLLIRCNTPDFDGIITGFTRGKIHFFRD